MLVQCNLIRKASTATLKNLGEISADSFCMIGRCEMLVEFVFLSVKPPALGTCEVMTSRGVGTQSFRSSKRSVAVIALNDMFCSLVLVEGFLATENPIVAVFTSVLFVTFVMVII